MPEGDTVHRSARTLSRALTGGTVVEVSTAAPAISSRVGGQLVGQAVGDVEARGKHLLVWFAPSGLALHTHLRMNGAWHLYRPGERWRRAARQARVALRTVDWWAVCFAAPVCELLGPTEVAGHPALARLGPDALAAAPDLDEARRRLDERAAWLVGDALLDQAVLAGIGNVYKSEVCFLAGIHPQRRVAGLTGPQRDELLRTACRLLRANAGAERQPRTTTGEPGPNRLAVYGRAGRRCTRCGEVIRAARQGRQARITYWCPGCQSAGPAAGGSNPSQTSAC